VLIVGGVLLGAVALVLVLTSLGGSSGTPSSTSSSSAQTASKASPKHTKTHRSATPKPAIPANAAEISVAVLNGTETTGLAHRISGQLQQTGYSQAAALAGSPPGSNQVTVVEYAAGHRSDAEAVARTLGTSQVQPIEGSVASLAPSASVAVIVGADKAAASP
jgi:hypothetical protein